MLTFPNVITAMITPFHEDGSVNYEAFRELAEKYTAQGSGILVAATTGEGAVMTEDEKLKLFKIAADALKDKTLVMANVGTNNTAQTIDLIKRTEGLGVDALLCIVPYYNKPNQDGCYAHFAAIAKSTKLPIFIYNVPGRTGGKIEAPTLCRLAHDFPNIIGLKDASGDLDYAGYVAANAPAGFHLYSGDDNLTLPIVAVGGEGVVSVASHVICKEMSEMIQAHKDGDVKKAAAMHQKYLPFMKGIFCTVSPVPIKTMVNMLGFPAGPLRLPLVEASPEVRAKCQQLLKDIGRL
ncbi:4-hydroxy-tetrahydrodipicolinate synthase [Megasphaera hominis]|jgi:4-hydroxy-tetrahydrodipicolinate synthase|uniref:4-hydroxy-tetrahydrodipicolinate synthase n=3 Tax=Megasphaera TaxID=906 RepID=A0ABR6VI78_9FIRM|nr:4-hydroxy-tetrahydrodipicolinate synthase [Megasphaera hominis]MBC3537003.1 4-hydroxy-tetrahydrodipicolinate synthase [Megasphaera hominis]